MTTTLNEILNVQYQPTKLDQTKICFVLWFSVPGALAMIATISLICVNLYSEIL